MYSRTIEGQDYSFGVSGKLIRNVLVMYDRQTESYWSQLLGVAVSGPLQGTTLAYLPSWQMTWADWKALHPDTVALAKTSFGSDPYVSYYASGQAGVIDENRFDDRLGVKDFVIGLEINGAALAFPFQVLNSAPLVQTELGGAPILVVFDADAAVGMVFNPVLNAELLHFSRADDGHLTDAETESTWHPLTGLALSGPLAGQSLARYKSTASFWFGWKDWYPETEVFNP